MRFFRRTREERPDTENVDATKGTGRVNGQRYSELPEGHRTTLVVGMADMLNCLAKYLDLDPRTRAAFEPIYKYEGEFISGDLRELFDKYMSNDPEGQTCGVASSFLSFLIEKSGAEKNLRILGN